MILNRRRLFGAAMLAAMLQAATACVAAATPNGDAIALASGLVTGATSDGVESFKGIPFAAPPVGPLRWRAPQAAAPWAGTRTALEFGHPCLQVDEHGAAAVGKPAPSEDCLYINVWRPAPSLRGAQRSASLPVMVWIYGGALLNGAASLPVYDGSQFARRGVILVSFNYRLGRFGFFAHPALTREAADGGRIANYGLMDQLAALAWVKKNIRAFGGDPRQVTIFGESAGAASVDVLMTVRKARGLFRAAIAESGYGRSDYARVTTVAPDGKQAAEQEGVALMSAVGVDTNDAATLRAVPAAAIQAKATYDLSFGFILDGTLLTANLWDDFRHGREAPIPFLLGSNSLETPPAPIAASSPYSHQLDAFVKMEDRPGLAAAYGGEQELDRNLSSDVVFAGQARSLALLHAGHGYPTFLYRFAAVPESVADRYLGAIHASEIPYVFDTLAAARWTMGPRDQALSEAMIAYWTAFAKTGRPEPPALPAWPRADGEHIMLFTDFGPQPAADDRTSRYQALSRVVDPRS